MVDAPHTKAELRNALRQRRHSLSPSQQAAASAALVQSVTQLPAWTDARHIALYLPQDGEIATGPLNAAARGQGMLVYLPVVTDADTLQFARWDSGTGLVENRYGIPEPPAEAARLTPGELDIVLIPLVGWDNYGNRLGMGGGYYDRTLSGQRDALLVGLAHECQCVEKLPRESWDVPMDYIATDAALYRDRGNGEKMEVLFGENNPGL